MTAKQIPPRDMTLNGVMFLDSANGGFDQVFKNTEYGVTLAKGRIDKNHPIVVTITVDGANGSWSTYEAMAADLLAQGWTA